MEDEATKMKAFEERVRSDSASFVERNIYNIIQQRRRQGKDVHAPTPKVEAVDPWIPATKENA